MKNQNYDERIKGILDRLNRVAKAQTEIARFEETGERLLHECAERGLDFLVFDYVQDMNFSYEQIVRIKYNIPDDVFLFSECPPFRVDFISGLKQSNLTNDSTPSIKKIVEIMVQTRGKPDDFPLDSIIFFLRKHNRCDVGWVFFDQTWFGSTCFGGSEVIQHGFSDEYFTAFRTAFRTLAKSKA